MTIVLDVNYDTFKKFKALQSGQFFYTENAVSFTIVCIFSTHVARTILMKPIDPETGEVDQNRVFLFRTQELNTYTGHQVLGISGIPLPGQIIKLEKLENRPEGSGKVIEDEGKVLDKEELEEVLEEEIKEEKDDTTR